VGACRLLGLLFKAGPAIDGGNAKAASSRDPSQLLFDLKGELARRREDQTRRGAVVRVDALDQRNREGEGLARSGGRLDEDVVAIEYVLDGERLNGERRVDTALRQCARNSGRYAEIGER
jgi:hypothetical protein